ncbi:hypothetical protein DFH06DRAFT_1314592 [Mycena polygramma]|nr:hypothetical protein DFH06DRAFT_1314592 [Mycena polygramma]
MRSNPLKPTRRLAHVNLLKSAHPTSSSSLPHVYRLCARRLVSRSSSALPSPASPSTEDPGPFSLQISWTTWQLECRQRFAPPLFGEMWKGSEMPMPMPTPPSLESPSPAMLPYFYCATLDSQRPSLRRIISPDQSLDSPAALGCGTASTTRCLRISFTPHPRPACATYVSHSAFHFHPHLHPVRRCVPGPAPSKSSQSKATTYLHLEAFQMPVRTHAHPASTPNAAALPMIQRPSCPSDPFPRPDPPAQITAAITSPADYTRLLVSPTTRYRAPCPCHARSAHSFAAADSSLIPSSSQAAPPALLSTTLGTSSATDTRGVHKPTREESVDGRAHNVGIGTAHDVAYADFDDATMPRHPDLVRPSRQGHGVDTLLRLSHAQVQTRRQCLREPRAASDSPCVQLGMRCARRGGFGGGGNAEHASENLATTSSPQTTTPPPPLWHARSLLCSPPLSTTVPTSPPFPPPRASIRAAVSPGTSGVHTLKPCAH